MGPEMIRSHNGKRGILYQSERINHARVRVEEVRILGILCKTSEKLACPTEAENQSMLQGNQLPVKVMFDTPEGREYSLSTILPSQCTAHKLESLDK